MTVLKSNLRYRTKCSNCELRDGLRTEDLILAFIDCEMSDRVWLSLDSGLPTLTASADWHEQFIKVIEFIVLTFNNCLNKKHQRYYSVIRNE